MKINLSVNKDDYNSTDSSILNFFEKLKIKQKLKLKI